MRKAETVRINEVMPRRVFVTGLGPVCSLGQDAAEFRENLFAGRTFVGRLAALAGSPVDFGAAVRDFRTEGILTGREGRLDRAACFAIAAAHRALEDGGLLQGPALGVVLGSSRGPTGRLEEAHAAFLARGPEGVGPRDSPYTTAGNLPGAVASHFGLKGPLLAVSAACSSAAQAIGLAFDLVRGGRAEAMLAGGTEACLTPFCMAMFAATGILSRRADDPPRASRPFDRDRDGCVVGEGAGVLLLESEEALRARGGRAHAEMAGWGATGDGGSLTAVPPDGEGLARAIRLALEDAALDPGEVAYVNAHGTATVAGDAAEAAAIRAGLCAHARRVKVSSTKSMTGHLFGAAGGIEAIASVLAVRDGVLPPTINLENPDPACDLDLVPGAALRADVPAALSLSMGFGGNNACLAFRRAQVPVKK